MSTGHVSHFVSQFVFTKCISSTELHITFFTLELVGSGVKVDVFLKITGLFEGFLTDMTLEWSLT